MPATALESRHLPAPSPTALPVPLLPTIAFGSLKGGTWKTSCAVAVAERLAFSGLSVLLLTTDQQEDSRSRLGIGPAEGPIARVGRGDGSITVVGLRGARAVDALYRSGPGPIGDFDVAILDSPPTLHAGQLPGIVLVVPLDGGDAARNAVTMLRGAPANIGIVLVRVGADSDAAGWQAEAKAIAQAAGREDCRYVPDPLPPSPNVKAAHDAGTSVWTLPRRGRTRAFLSGIETLAAVAWEHAGIDRPMPPPPPAASLVYVPGWDDDDAA